MKKVGTLSLTKPTKYRLLMKKIDYLINYLYITVNMKIIKILIAKLINLLNSTHIE